MLLRRDSVHSSSSEVKFLQKGFQSLPGFLCIFELAAVFDFKEFLDFPLSVFRKDSLTVVTAVSMSSVDLCMT